MNSFERVTAARVLSGLTNEDLATRLGIARINVQRWQSKTSLPKRKLAPLADITGFPEKWLRDDGELEGLIVARPLRLASNARPQVVQRLAKQVSDILPVLCSGSGSTELRAPSGSAYVYFTNNYCLVVFAPHELHLKLNLQCDRIIDVPDCTMSAAYSEETSVAVEDLLKLSGLDAWADKVPQIDRISVTGSIVLKISFQDTELTPVINEVKRLTKTLRSQGCEVSMYHQPKTQLD